MKLNKKFKSLLKLTNDLELYELSVHNNLERLEESIEEMKIEDPDSFERAVGMVFAPDDEDLLNLLRGTAETLETIFLKTRHVLSLFPLDTVAQERLETLGVNFDIDTGNVVQLDNFEKEIN